MSRKWEQPALVCLLERLVAQSEPPVEERPTTRQIVLLLLLGSGDQRERVQISPDLAMRVVTAISDFLPYSGISGAAQALLSPIQFVHFREVWAPYQQKIPLGEDDIQRILAELKAQKEVLVERLGIGGGGYLGFREIASLLLDVFPLTDPVAPA